MTMSRDRPSIGITAIGWTEITIPPVQPLEEKRMKCFIVLLFLFIATVAYSEPFVNSDMIEISYDGVSFADASLLISDIVISVGAVTSPHITHARRGDIITFEAQLGPPYTDMKVAWKLDTSQVAQGENKLYMKNRWGVSETLSDGTIHTTTAPFSESSGKVQLVGRSGKPVKTK